MKEQIIESLTGIPPEIATLIISTLPVIELRGAIPVAIWKYELGVFSAYFWSVTGNIIPAFLLIFFLDAVSGFLMKKSKLFKKFFTWLFERTRKRAHKKIEKYGDWGLFFLVAIPLPMTGGWTGALAAFLFGIEKKKAFGVVSLGIMAAGVIVTVLTLGILD